MPEPAIGFRIYLNTRRPQAYLLDAFRGVPTGNISDAMDRFGAMEYRIKPLDQTMHVVGAALTVRTRPGDNLMVWKALDIAQPGDVLVIATYDFTTTSTFGDRFVMGAKARGLAGIVSDGMCRDVKGILETGMPTFVRGAVPSSPEKDGPGEIGGVVTCGGIPIHPGDVVVGDRDGVVIVPLDDVAAVVARLQAIREKEVQMLENVESGQLVPEWVNTTLAEKGCEIIDLQE